MLEFFELIKPARVSYEQLIPIELIKYPADLLDSNEDPRSREIPYHAEFYHLPSGFYVPRLRSKGEAAALADLIFNQDTTEIAHATVHHLMPQVLIAHIDIDEDAGELVWVDDTGKQDRYPVADPQFYKSALLGLNFAAPVAGVAAEAVKDFSKLQVPKTTDFDPVAFLTTYLTLTAVDPKVPLLIGHTGVAKSAIVKAAAQNAGMRLIDIRCGFIDKTDIEGYTTVLEDEGVFEQAPMMELITATDQFLANVRNFLEKNGDRKDLSPEDQAYLSKLREMAKTPVIFFDEVNRAPISVRNAFTNILNKKQFLTYSMEEAKVVSAANAPIFNQGINDEDMIEFYMTKEMDDIASLERFISIPIDPRSPQTRGNWLDWAANRRQPPFDPFIMKFLEDNPDAAYDISSIQKAAQAMSKEPAELSDVKMTTYRGWEQMNDYYVAQIKEKDEFFSQLVMNILGNTDAASKFMTYLTRKGKKKRRDDFETDDLTQSLEEGLDAGVPVLLAATTSVGKTSRVRNYAKRHGTEFIEIDLALKDRTQIRGVPEAVPISRALGFGIADDVQHSELAEAFGQAVDADPKLPKATTAFVPDKTIVERLKNALANNKKVTIFFDEVNRCKPVVMSAVFEAISDNRFMGVHFPPGAIQVVAACNVGDQFGGTTRLDPAFTARFFMARKDVVDESDYNAFKTWASGPEGLDPVLARVVESLGYDKYNDMMAQVGKRTLETNVPTSRAIESLSKLVQHSVLAKSYMRGFLITINRDFDDMSNDDIIARMHDPDWVGNRPNSAVMMDMGGGQEEYISGKDIRETFEARPVAANKNALVIYESLLQKERKNIFTAYLGTSSLVTQIAEIYDRFEQGRIYEIKDLVDPTLTGKFLEQHIDPTIADTEAGAQAMGMQVMAIFLEHHDVYTEKEVLTVMKQARDFAASAAVARELLKTLASQSRVAGVQSVFETIDVAQIESELTTLYG